MAATRSAKIVLLGAKSSGKTALFTRWIYEDWTEKAFMTISASLGMKHTNGQNLCVWDTAGEEKFEMLTCYHMQNSQCCIVVIDPTQTQNLDYYSKLCDSIKEAANKNVRILLISTKSDLKLRWKANIADSISTIHKIFSEKFEKMDIPHIEVSSKEDVGIDKIRSTVDQFLEKMIEKLPITEIQQPSSASAAAAVSESDTKIDEKTSLTIAGESLDLTKESDKDKAIQLIDKMLSETPPPPYLASKEALDYPAFKFREKKSSAAITATTAVESDVKAVADKKVENTQPSSTKFSLFSLPIIQNNTKQAEDNDPIVLLQQRLILLKHAGWTGNEDLRSELQKRIGEEMMQLGKHLYDQATSQKKSFSSAANSF